MTITGTHLANATSVKFGSLEAPSFSVMSDARIDATVPDGAVPGKISVETPGATATSTSDFTPTLSITGFSPGSGPGRTIVDINGIGFTPGAVVRFDGTGANVTYVSPGELKASQPLAATTGPITVSNASAPVGTVRARGDYTVSLGIDSLSPTSGVTGSVVAISGSALGGATGVKFGGLSASFEQVSGTQITATVPDGAVPGKVSVTTATGIGRRALRTLCRRCRLRACRRRAGRWGRLWC